MPFGGRFRRSSRPFLGADIADVAQAAREMQERPMLRVHEPEAMIPGPPPPAPDVPTAPANKGAGGKGCCVEFRFTEPRFVNLITGQKITKALLAADKRLRLQNGSPQGPIRILFDRTKTPQKKRLLTIRICGGSLTSIDDLINLEETDPDHPARILERAEGILNPKKRKKELGPGGRPRARIPIKLVPRFRCVQNGH